MLRTIFAVAAALAVNIAFAAPLPLAQDGQSAYSIYVEAAAPSSVKAAAADLQTYFEQVTGAKLPIINEHKPPMIVLGANSVSARAGLTADKLPIEGYRLVTKGVDLFILGPDAADGALTPAGGTSNGTANGVYAFIEKALGVRWLMPGEHGDYIPSLKSLSLETDLTDAPFFLNRRVPYTQEKRPETKQWWARQRLGYSLSLYHSHNWQHFNMADFKAHPEWFAEQGGNRMPPAGDRFKLCVTNPGLVRVFAERAIKYFDDKPEATCYSLSPTDSAGWCECANCKARYEKTPAGELSVTPAIIHFYNNVAKLVAQKYPQKLLAGYVYADYVYPPSNPIPLASNVFLVWAPSFDYGFTLYRPDIQKQWDELVPQWLKVTRNISYYDLPNCIHNEMGAINPPGLKILEWLYPRLKQSGMKGVYVYGSPAWGYAGPMNYLLAKLAWNPDANVDALFNEYIEKCYGAGAPEMKQFFLLLDDATEKYFNENHKETYTLSEDRLRKVYGANFPELERLYHAADAKIQEPEAKARLAMLGANMTILQWNLRQMKAMDNPQASSFNLSDKDFFAFLKPWNNSFAIAPSASSNQAGLKDKLTVKATTAPNAEPVTPFLLRGNQRLIIKATGAEAPVVTFSAITSRGKLVKYQLYDAAGAPLDQGVVSTEPVTLPQDQSDWFIMTIVAGSASFSVDVKNAAWAISANTDDKGLHLLGKTTPLYFDVPANTTGFDLWLSSDAPGETAAARLYAPDGKLVTTFRTVEKTIDAQQIKVGEGQAGVWKIVIEKADIGIVDDVYVKLDDKLPGYFSMAPQSALSVIRAE
ncbi:MAG: DUF4838 domain-containing protein [Armatimonadota bacterium]